jgi:hypothetical protein
MSNSPSRLGTGKSVQLHDNGLRAGSLLEQLPAYLTSEQVQKLAAEAVEESIRIEGKARELDLDYRAATRATEEHIHTVNRLPGGQIHSTTTSINTGSRNITIKSGACFVATTAYGGIYPVDIYVNRIYPPMATGIIPMLYCSANSGMKYSPGVRWVEVSLIGIGGQALIWRVV